MPDSLPIFGIGDSGDLLDGARLLLEVTEVQSALEQEVAERQTVVQRLEAGFCELREDQTQLAKEAIMASNTLLSTIQTMEVQWRGELSIITSETQNSVTDFSAALDHLRSEITQVSMDSQANNSELRNCIEESLMESQVTPRLDCSDPASGSLTKQDLLQLEQRLSEQFMPASELSRFTDFHDDIRAIEKRLRTDTSTTIFAQDDVATRDDLLGLEQRLRADSLPANLGNSFVSHEDLANVEKRMEAQLITLVNSNSFASRVDLAAIADELAAMEGSHAQFLASAPTGGNFDARFDEIHEKIRYEQDARETQVNEVLAALQSIRAHSNGTIAPEQTAFMSAESQHFSDASIVDASKMMIDDLRLELKDEIAMVCSEQLLSNDTLRSGFEQQKLTFEEFETCSNERLLAHDAWRSAFEEQKLATDDFQTRAKAQLAGEAQERKEQYQSLKQAVHELSGNLTASVAQLSAQLSARAASEARAAQDAHPQAEQSAEALARGETGKLLEKCRSMLLPEAGRTSGPPILQEQYRRPMLRYLEALDGRLRIEVSHVFDDHAGGYAALRDLLMGRNASLPDSAGPPLSLSSGVEGPMAATLEGVEHRLKAELAQVREWRQCALQVALDDLDAKQQKSIARALKDFRDEVVRAPALPSGASAQPVLGAWRSISPDPIRVNGIPESSSLRSLRGDKSPVGPAGAPGSAHAEIRTIDRMPQQGVVTAAGIRMAAPRRALSPVSSTSSFPRRVHSPPRPGAPGPPQQMPVVALQGCAKMGGSFRVPLTR